MKIITWDSKKASQEIQKRYKAAQQSRKHREDRWITSERAVFMSTGLAADVFLNNLLDLTSDNDISEGDDSTADMNVSYAFKNFRFNHAQMSANPPSVVMRPTSSDQDDRRKADAADRVVRYSLRKYTLQERIDQMSLSTLLYGTGFTKHIWSSSKGEILEVDEETGELKLDGDIDITVPFIWNVYVDPDAKDWSQVRWIIERIYMDYEEACSRWPEKEDELKQSLVARGTDGESHENNRTQLQNDRFNSVELLEYWETGTAPNGYLGRYCITTINGACLEDPKPNPYRFKKAGAVAEIENDKKLSDEEKEKKIERLPSMAQLPFTSLTDIDVPNSIWGKSVVEYASHLQEYLNRVDSARIDNLEAHSAARMIVPDGTDVDADMPSNNTWEVTRITGNQPPYYMKPPDLMPDMTGSRNDLIVGINDVFGVNESMFGQQSREQSGASMQYATNQGNMIRRRLFNKYVLAVESIYKAILNLVRKHWTVQRTIHVLGKENALEAIDLKGADIDGGYDVVGEYGVSLSLDPMTRREEIMMLQPLFEKAGIPVRQLLGMMKLNELDGIYDKLKLAELRQKEIFDIMIAKEVYLAPEEFMDHDNMIAWALDYFMTSEFTYLSEDLKLLCKQHIRERIALSAQEKSGMAGAPTQPGMAPAPAAAPMASPAEAVQATQPLPA